MKIEKLTTFDLTSDEWDKVEKVMNDRLIDRRNIISQLETELQDPINTNDKMINKG